jgi:N-acyl-D-amino-acid deacylase
VREERLLSLEEAVRKMTSLSAARFGLADRGVLREGAAADVTVFDPERVWDNTTYLEPELEPSGIEYVLVNGTVLADHGAVDTTTLAGTVIRR